MTDTSVRHIAVSRRAYLYLALVPMCSVGWTVLIVFLGPHLSEPSLYRMLDGFLYLAAVGVVILAAVPVRFRRSSDLVKLVAVSICCGLILAFVTFVGYMTVGFG
jgi:peptidoglycan/LPS O-acetylase OafA/YrhL